MKRNKLKPLSADPDFYVSDVYAQFRRLCCGVFNRALMDLMHSDRLIRDSAVKWFRAKEPKKRETAIYFTDCIEVLDFKQSRLEKLSIYVKLGELGQIQELRKLIEETKGNIKLL